MVGVGLIASFLVFAAGLFENAAFFASEAVLATLADFAEDVVHCIVGRFIEVVGRIVHTQRRSSAQLWHSPFTRQPTTQLPTELEINQCEKRSTDVGGVGDVAFAV